MLGERLYDQFPQHLSTSSHPRFYYSPEVIISKKGKACKWGGEQASKNSKLTNKLAVWIGKSVVVRGRSPNLPKRRQRETSVVLGDLFRYRTHLSRLNNLDN